MITSNVAREACHAHTLNDTVRSSKLAFLMATLGFCDVGCIMLGHCRKAVVAGEFFESLTRWFGDSIILQEK